jgi:tetratricopeptide (TPR) repeat protein
MTFPFRFPISLLGAACLFPVLGDPAPTTNPPPAHAAKPADVDTSANRQLYRDVGLLKNKGDIDGAIAKLSEAMQSDPANYKDYVLRGDLYAKKQRWSDAEQDFNTALKLDPGNGLAKLDLAEIQLMQKKYDTARVAFAALTGDPQFGDLAAYKIYLCDLFNQDQMAASKELAAFNKAGRKASYYYANGAHALYLGNTEEARNWIQAGVKIYPPEKTFAYLSTLKDFGYLPLPPAPEKK